MMLINWRTWEDSAVFKAFTLKTQRYMTRDEAPPKDRKYNLSLLKSNNKSQQTINTMEL